MTRETRALLEAFKALPAEQKDALEGKILRRSPSLDSHPLENEEIGAASAALFELLDEDWPAKRRLP
jgi:hypothetical protein